MFSLVIYFIHRRVYKKRKFHSCVQFFVIPWTVACLASLSIEFFRQKYWSGLPFPSPGDLSNPGIEPKSPSLQADSLPTEPLGKPRPSIHVSFSEALQVVLPADQVGDYGEFSSVAQPCPTLCDPLNHSMPGFPVHYQLPEFTQTHVH